jgi:peptidoglycan/LPS O-acetylase OafA/YrhL
MVEAIAPVREETATAADASVARTVVRAAGSGYIATLDGWRALAVGLVIASHALGPLTPWRDACGALGVSIFFGISGYLICNRLLAEGRDCGRINLRAFYVRRAFRILPPAFTLLTAIAGAAALGLISASVLEVTASALFFRNYVPGHWYTSHFWSLAVEEHFYLFFPALLVTAGPRRTTGIALAISVATAAWRIVDTRFGLLSSRMPAGVYAAARTDFRLDGLMLGCFAALLLHRGVVTIRRKPALLTVPVTIAVLAANTFGMVPLPEVFKATAIVALLVSSTFTPDAPIGWFLELAPVRWVGRLSYSLYLWQQVFLIKYQANRVPILDFYQRSPFALVMLFVASSISYYLIERPMIKLGHRLVHSPVPTKT